MRVTIISPTRTPCDTTRRRQRSAVLEGLSDAGSGWPSRHGDGQQGKTTVYWEDQLSLPIFHLPPSCTISMVPVVFFLSESSALTVSVAPVAVLVSLTILTLVSVPIILIISNICARSAGGVA